MELAGAPKRYTDAGQENTNNKWNKNMKKAPLQAFFLFLPAEGHITLYKPLCLYHWN